MRNPEDCPLWLIAGCPKNSDRNGPFSASAGKRVLERLEACGVRRDDIHIEYLYPKPPPSGHLANGVGYYEQQGILEPKLAEVMKKVKKAKPNLVLGFGSDVLRLVFGKHDILKWRGHVFFDDYLGVKALMTFDPFHAEAQKKVEKKKKPGQYQVLLECDVARAAKEYVTPDISFAEPRYILGPSYTETVQWLEKALDTAKVVSYDIETLAPYEGRLIDCIGLSTSTEEAICIPFYMMNPEKKVIRYWKHDVEYFHIYCLVKELMESCIPKVAQNSQFDTSMLAHYFGIHVQNVIFDTMIYQHNLYCDLPKDLGTLISLYTSLPYHKYMIHSSSHATRWEYNAADAVANLHVMQGEICETYEIEGKRVPELPTDGEIPSDFWKLNLARHYLSVTNPGIESCVKMHLAGVRINPTIRDKALGIELEFIKQAREALDGVITFNMNGKNDHNFNPFSTQQKNILFYKLLGCSPIKVKGRPTCDKKAMKKIADKYGGLTSLLARACLDIKASDASILKFKVEPDDGRIRTQYDVAGTDTGRLASNESEVLPGGTNLQNVHKGPERQMFIPEKGEEFALVDLYAAEAFLTALDAGEIEMLRMISGLDEKDIKLLGNIRIMSSKTASEYKIHNWMRRQTWDTFPLECKEANYTYKDAKQTIHGLNYNVQPMKMTQESGLPLHVAEWQYNRYHTLFPGIKLRMKRINIQLSHSMSVTSALGRWRKFIMEPSQELYNTAYAWPSQSCIGEITIAAQNYLHMISDLSEAGADLPFCRPVMNTHDGLVIRVKKGERHLVIPYILRAFKIPLTFGDMEIIIPVSIGWGPNFNDMEDEDVYFYPLSI